MKPLLVLVASGLLGLGVAACGSSKATSVASESVASRGGTTARATGSVNTTSPAVAPNTPPQPEHHASVTKQDLEKYDRDEDDYIHAPDDNNSDPIGYRVAGVSDRLAISKLVKSYYAAALAGSGARACSLMFPQMVKAVPLDFGKLGPYYLRHVRATCPAVMSRFFQHEHRQLVREVPQLGVVRVSVKVPNGLAILRFGKLHERFISELHEGGRWYIASELDGELE